MAYTECVLKGAKPVAHIVVSQRQTGFLTRYLWRRGLRVYYQCMGLNVNAFIYRDPKLLREIRLINFRSRNPEDHARYGRLFGYDEESISEYVQRAFNQHLP